MFTRLALLFVIAAVPAARGDHYPYTGARYGHHIYIGERSLSEVRRLAEAGYPDARYELGNRYLHGDGAPYKPARAYFWYRLAADQGHPAAADAADYLAGYLTPEQIERARHRARDYLGERPARHADHPAAAAFNRRDVLFLQRALHTLGYDPGPVDGRFGPQTRQALDRYRDRHRLPDSEPSSALFGHLQDSLDRQREIPYRPAAPPIAESNHGDGLRHDLDAEAITLIQRALTRLGYQPGPADGRFGPQTRLAIRVYQQDNRLPEDGQPTPELMDHLAERLQDNGLSNDERYTRR